MSSLKDKLKNSPVFITDCDTYDADRIRECINEAFSSLDITRELIDGKRVLIKPNLVLAKKTGVRGNHAPRIHKSRCQNC